MKITIGSLMLLTFFIAVSTKKQAAAQADVSRVLVSDSLLKKHVYMLASDSLQGRETGTPGQFKAAVYCGQVFRQSHLLAAFRLDSVRGSFRQTYAFTISEVAPFGRPSNRYFMDPGGYITYKKLELIPIPTTAKDSSRALFGHNVGGLLLGSDLKREVLVISAHYDHLGHLGKRVFYGADDNASGTATVLSVAATFDSLARQGIRPRRSILFVLFSGEEGGLLGSTHFMDNCPVSLQQLVGDLNVDMVGRVDDAHQKQPDYCYLLTNELGDTLKKMAERANQQSVKLMLNQGGYDTAKDPMQYFSRSDHYNFARLGIPTLFFTNGEHPDYHKATDTADKIAYDVLRKRATLVFQTAWLVVNPP